MFGNFRKAILATAVALLSTGFAAAGHGGVYVHVGGHFHGGFGYYGGFHHHYGLGFGYYGPRWGYYGSFGPWFYPGISVSLAPTYVYSAPPVVAYSPPVVATYSSAPSAPAYCSTSRRAESVGMPAEVKPQAPRSGSQLPRPAESKSFRYDGDRPAAPPVEQIPRSRDLNVPPVPPVPDVPTAPAVPKLGPSPTDMATSVPAAVAKKTYAYPAYGQDRLSRPAPRDDKTLLIRRDK